MPYVAKSEEQLAKEGLLPDGEYDFEVTATDDKPSKSGNEMFTLSLNVFGDDGNGHFVKDYIALGSNFGERKLRHAADACGLIAVYESGKLKAADFMGKSGKVKIKTQAGNADFPMPKNTVADYVKRTPGLDPVKAEHKAVAKQVEEEDSIPF